MEINKEEIEAAVKDFEAHCDGELVPFISNQSDDYSEANFMSALSFMLMAIVIYIGLSYQWMVPGNWQEIYVLLSLVVIGIIGYFLPFLSWSYKLSLISPKKEWERVNDAAQLAFLSENMFSTKERTGVLVYVSLNEKKVVVLGDQGINSKVEAEDWNHVIDEILKGIHSKDLTKGLVNGIQECKNLFLDKGIHTVERGNELSNEIKGDL